MKAILAVVLLGLISSSLAFYNVRKVPPTIIDTSFLKNADTPKKHTFAGLTNLMQQLRDVSSVQNFLDGLLDDLANVRQQKLAIIEQTRANCEEEDEFRNEAVSEGQRAATAAQAQISLCSAQKDQALHLKDLAASALAIDQGELADLTAAREAARALFETSVAKINKARDAIAQLQALIDNFEANANSPLDSAQFIQTSNSLLRHSVSTGHSHLVLPVFTRLLQMHARQSVSADDLAQIRQLLNVLDENGANTLQGLNNQEDEDQQEYDAKSSNLQRIIDNLTNQVAATQQHADTMDQCLAQENSILDLSNDKVSRNADLLATSQTLCAAAEDEWRLSELNRSREVNIINALKSAINKLEGDYEQDEGPKAGDIIQLRML